MSVIAILINNRFIHKNNEYAIRVRTNLILCRSHWIFAPCSYFLLSGIFRFRPFITMNKNGYFVTQDIISLSIAEVINSCQLEWRTRITFEHVYFYFRIRQKKRFANVRYLNVENCVYRYASSRQKNIKKKEKYCNNYFKYRNSYLYIKGGRCYFFRTRV